MLYEWNDKLNTSAPLWSLDLDSRLLYVGGVGNTGAYRPSEWKGIEMENYHQSNNWLSFDFDLVLTDASFSGIDLAENDIPGLVVFLNLAD